MSFLAPDFLRLRLFFWRNPHQLAHGIVEFDRLAWFYELWCGHLRTLNYPTAPVKNLLHGSNSTGCYIRF